MICPHGYDEGVIERLATPEEVDAGCELGITFAPCIGCAEDRWVAEHGPAPDGYGWSTVNGGATFDLVPMPGFRLPPDTLLGVPDDDYDQQAETGQGPPA